MDFMKKTLNQVNVHENTLYKIIYDLFFFFMSFLEIQLEYFMFFAPFMFYYTGFCWIYLNNCGVL